MTPISTPVHDWYPHFAAVAFPEHEEKLPVYPCLVIFGKAIKIGRPSVFTFVKE